MTSHPVTCEGFPAVGDCTDALCADADVLSPFRGILLGIGLCAPLWAAFYLVFRSMWS
jgi:hypothetical protein